MDVPLFGDGFLLRQEFLPRLQPLAAGDDFRVGDLRRNHDV